MGTLHEDLYRMRNFPGESHRENQNAHFMFSNFFSKNCAVCDLTWENMVEPDRRQMII